MGKSHLKGKSGFHAPIKKIAKNRGNNSWNDAWQLFCRAPCRKLVMSKDFLNLCDGQWICFCKWNALHKQQKHFQRHPRPITLVLNLNQQLLQYLKQCQCKRGLKLNWKDDIQLSLHTAGGPERVNCFFFSRTQKYAQCDVVMPTSTALPSWPLGQRLGVMSSAKAKMPWLIEVKTYVAFFYNGYGRIYAGR